MTYDSTDIVRVGRLWNIRPSLFVDRHGKVRLLKRILRLAVDRKLPLHIWFHPLDLGYDKKTVESSIRTVYYPFFEFAKKKQEDGLLEFETMLSATRRQGLEIERK